MAEDAIDYSAVNKVMALCKDAEEGFRGAATAIENPTLQSLFNQLSFQGSEHQIPEENDRRENFSISRYRHPLSSGHGVYANCLSAVAVDFR